MIIQIKRCITKCIRHTKTITSSYSEPTMIIIMSRLIEIFIQAFVTTLIILVFGTTVIAINVIAFLINTLFSIAYALSLLAKYVYRYLVYFASSEK